MPNNELAKYAGLAMQFLVTLAVTIFIGIKADEHFHLKFPILTIILPAAILIVTFWKIYKDTSR